MCVLLSRVGRLGRHPLSCASALCLQAARTYWHPMRAPRPCDPKGLGGGALSGTGSGVSSMNLNASVPREACPSCHPPFASQSPRTGGKAHRRGPPRRVPSVRGGIIGMVCHAVSCLGWRGCFAYCIGSVRVLVRTPYDPKDLGTATPSVRKVISKHGAVPSSAEALSWDCLAATQRPCGLMHLTEAPRVPPLPVLSRERSGESGSRHRHASVLVGHLGRHLIRVLGRAQRPSFPMCAGGSLSEAPLQRH